MAHFKLLYHFANEQINIIEIKRNDIVSDKKEDLYFWLLMEAKANFFTVKRLHFIAMKSNETVESRTFQNANLQFDTHSATFENEYGKFFLKAKNELSPEIEKIISEFLIA